MRVSIDGDYDGHVIHDGVAKRRRFFRGSCDACAELGRRG
jgi:hypothetical protein